MASEGQIYGPYSPEEIEEHIKQGRITQSFQACLEGTDDWRPLSEFAQAATGTPERATPQPSLITGSDPAFMGTLSISPQNLAFLEGQEIATHKKDCPFCGNKKTKRAPRELQFASEYQLLVNRYCPKCGGAWKRGMSESLAQIEFAILLVFFVGVTWNSIARLFADTPWESAKIMFSAIGFICSVTLGIFVARSASRLVSKKYCLGIILKRPVQ